MISDPVIRPVIRPYLLIYVAVADLVPLELALLRSLLLLKHRIHPLLQFLQRPRLVRMLIPLILACGNSTCRHMSGSHCRVRLVDMLAARATRSVSVNPDVLLVDVELLGDLGHHCHSGCAGVHAALLLGLWNTLDFMDTGLMLQMFVNVFTRDLIDT